MGRNIVAQTHSWSIFIGKLCRNRRGAILTEPQAHCPMVITAFEIVSSKRAGLRQGHLWKCTQFHLHKVFAYRIPSVPGTRLYQINPLNRVSWNRLL